MKKSRLLILFMLLALPCRAQKYFPGSYYITQNGDTIRTTIAFYNIVDIQYVLHILQPDSSIRSIYPNDVKGFYLNTNNQILYWLDSTPNHRHGKVIRHIKRLSSFSFYPKIYDSPARLASDPFLEIQYKLLPLFPLYSGLFFKSVKADTNIVFMHVLTERKVPFQFISFYACSRLQKHSVKSQYVNPPYFISGYVFLLKDEELFLRQKGETKMNWLARAVADDKPLSKVIRENMIDLTYYDFQPRMDIIADEYNCWRNNMQDTTLFLKGILQADTCYKPNPAIFWSHIISSPAYPIVGCILCIAMEAQPKLRNLNIPTSCSYCNNEEYLYGYRMRAYQKKGNLVHKGSQIGLCLFLIEFGLMLWRFIPSQ